MINVNNGTVLAGIHVVTTSENNNIFGNDYTQSGL
ncbi:unnamed protein product, partial [marine sediment metagenome]